MSRRRRHTLAAAHPCIDAVSIDAMRFDASDATSSRGCFDAVISAASDAQRSRGRFAGADSASAVPRTLPFSARRLRQPLSQHSRARRRTLVEAAHTRSTAIDTRSR
jgi:hypothetical protein